MTTEDVVSKAQQCTKRFSHSLLAGAAAGFAVDLSLYPIDTIKTRMQSRQGFWRAGGFKRIYAGIPSIVFGSAPGSALFFGTYELCKRVFQSSQSRDSGYYRSILPHMTSAAVGEVVACMVRVPTEVVKQRAQAQPHKKTNRIFREILALEGLPGFYRGYSSTIAREIPFSAIQFPIWELLKRYWAQRQHKSNVNPFEAAACGAFAGAVAAAATTPFDVAKTRIMLEEKLKRFDSNELRVDVVLKNLWQERGVRGLFAGVLPRVLWISIGGFIFLGAFEESYILIRFLARPADAESPVFVSSKLPTPTATDYVAVDDTHLSLERLWYKFQNWQDWFINDFFHPKLLKTMPKTWDEAKERAELFEEKHSKGLDK